MSKVSAIQLPIPVQGWYPEVERYQALAETVLSQARAAGATQAEVRLGHSAGFSVLVRMGAVETLSYHRDKRLSLTVYKGQQKGSASTTNLNASAIEQTVQAAYHIAQLTQADPASGLAEAALMAHHYPDLDLHHPWAMNPMQAIELAQCCEAQAMAVDTRIDNAEGTGVDTAQAMTLYANSHGFMGHYLGSRHSLHCILVAKDAQGHMQRDGNYTVSRDPRALQAIEQFACEAGQRTIGRLGARRLKTCQAAVVFQAEVAASLIGHFLGAISGGALYRKTSFLLDQLHRPVFAACVHIQEQPYLAKGLGSVPFDAEGVAPKDRDLVVEGVLQDYLLSSYSAKRLGMQTTGNAGGAHNIVVSAQVPDLPSLLQQMDTGLLVTELLGHGVNPVTGDYSQGAAGFWVEKGQIQYPVEEITIAGNLRDMYQAIIAIAADVDTRSAILTGSILIKNMTIAGEG